MNNSTIFHILAHAIREAEGWECDPEMNLAESDNIRAQIFAQTAEFIVKKLNEKGYFIKPEGKEWEDVVHDLNQEIEELTAEVYSLERKYADAVDKIDVAGKKADELATMAKEIVSFTGR